MQDGAKTETSGDDLDLDRLAVSKDGMGIDGPWLVATDALEEQLVERAIGAPVDGQNSVPRTQPSFGRGVEHLDHDVGACVVLGSPAEIGTLRPAKHVQGVQAQDCEGQREGEAEAGPIKRRAWE